MIIMVHDGYGQNSIKLKFEYLFNGEAFALNQDFKDWSGKTINISRAQFYISMHKVVYNNGSEVNLIGNYLLVDNQTTEFVLDSTVASIADIKEIEFGLGVEPDVNHEDPSLWPANHPLSHKSPNMHWGWTAGYKFLVLEGMVDSDDNGSVDELFQLHVVGDEYYRTLTMKEGLTANSNELELSTIVDIGKWFVSTDMATAGIIHGGGAVIEQTMDNTPIVFGLEHDAVSVTEVDQNQSIQILQNDEEVTIKYSLKTPQNLDLEIYNVQGVLVDAHKVSGDNGLIELDNLAAGTYVYLLKNDKKSILSSKFVRY